MAGFTVDAKQHELLESKHLAIRVLVPATAAGAAAAGTSLPEDSTSLPATVTAVQSPDSASVKAFSVEYMPVVAFSVEYMPVVAGDHAILVTYFGDHVPGSPFRATIRQLPDASRCVMETDHSCLDPTPQSTQRYVYQLLTGEKFRIAVKTDSAGDGQMSAAAVHLDKQQSCDVGIVVLEGKRHRIQSSDLTEAGQYRFDVKWSGEHITGSPFTATVSERLTADRIKVCQPNN